MPMVAAAKARKKGEVGRGLALVFEGTDSEGREVDFSVKYVEVAEVDSERCWFALYEKHLSLVKRDRTW